MPVYTIVICTALTRINDHLSPCMKPATPKRVHWQTVKTQMKCYIMQHFIRDCTVCQDTIDLQRKITLLFLKIITMNPKYIQWTILTS